MTLRFQRRGYTWVTRYNTLTQAEVNPVQAHTTQMSHHSNHSQTTKAPKRVGLILMLPELQALEIMTLRMILNPNHLDTRSGHLLRKKAYDFLLAQDNTKQTIQHCQRRHSKWVLFYNTRIPAEVNLALANTAQIIQLSPKRESRCTQSYNNPTQTEVSQDPGHTTLMSQHSSQCQTTGDHNENDLIVTIQSLQVLEITIQLIR